MLDLCTVVPDGVRKVYFYHVYNRNLIERHMKPRMSSYNVLHIDYMRIYVVTKK